MITVVSGKIGSGKSHDCVRLIMRHLANGGCVRTNISLDYKKIGKAVGRRLSPYQIGKLSADDNPSEIPIGDKRGHGKRRTLVVLDEALNWFQSEARSEGDSRKKAWSEWLRQSDKLGQDVWFICQNFDRSAKWIRELAQVSKEIIPCGKVHLFSFVPLWWFFPFIRRSYMVVSRDVRSKQIQGYEFHRYTRRVWDFYDTAETFGFQAASSAYDRLNLWPAYRRPVVGAFLCGGLALCTLGIDIFCMLRRL